MKGIIAHLNLLCGGIELTEQKMKRYIGLRNIVTGKKYGNPIWQYLLHYEIDGHDENQLHSVLDMLNRMQISYIAYKTLNGYHFVGLTPISAQEWGNYFQRLQNRIPEYFSGQTLRMSLKEDERQELISANFNYPYLQRLARPYITRLEIPENTIPTYGEMPVYSCMFDKYWTGKIR